MENDGTLEGIGELLGPRQEAVNPYIGSGTRGTHVLPSLNRSSAHLRGLQQSGAEAQKSRQS